MTQQQDTNGKNTQTHTQRARKGGRRVREYDEKKEANAKSTYTHADDERKMGKNNSKYTIKQK